jgi:hypothetical protein
LAKFLSSSSLSLSMIFPLGILGIFIFTKT